MKVYNYLGKDIRLYEIDWEDNSIKNVYDLESSGDIEIEEDANYNISDNINIKVYKPLNLPKYNKSKINIVNKIICDIVRDIRPDLRYPSGKITDPQDNNNYGYSLLLDWKNS